jgi:putative ABC transport system permease protein
MRVLEITRLGFKNLRLHKLRATLTALGIIFGVGAVVSMLSIGEGAKWEALQQIKLLGIQNVTVRSIKPPEEQENKGSQSDSRTYGIRSDEPFHILQTIPAVTMAVPMKERREDVRYRDRKTEARIVGTTPEYLNILNLETESGRFFNSFDGEKFKKVCVIGQAIKRELFQFIHPIGKKIRVGGQWLTVIGVMEDKSIRGKGGAIKVHDLNRDIYLPYKTMLKRFGPFIVTITSSSFNAENVDVDELILQIDNERNIEYAANAIRRFFENRHDKSDWEIIVPLELMRQSQRTSRIFSIVIGSIASISLLVGGIGIMNIMLATVTERTAEIGIRRAMGARRKDIIYQFLIETVVLSVSGGVIGITIGVVGAKAVSYFAEMRTIVTFIALLVAFTISVMVGIVFGMYPANKAANMNPIEALRYE